MPSIRSSIRGGFLALGLVAVALLALFLGQGGAPTAHAQGPSAEGTPQKQEAASLAQLRQRFLADQQAAQPLSPLAAQPCVGGTAAGYPCQNVDLMSFLPLASIGGGNGNDIWGWTDPTTGREYALMGRTSGTAFVDITDPENPLYLGNLPTQTSNSVWRDIKVYNNYAFVVSEASDHGMQIFDLTRLRSVPAPPVTFTVDAHYAQFGNAHNLVINEGTGFAYGVGTSTCSGGLHMVNIQNPLAPTNAGCFSADGYTHDAQCVLYTGPDVTYQGQEICFNSNVDTLTVVDVTNKAAPLQLSRTGYEGSGYAHQSWLTEDQRYVLLDDELDEQNFGHGTRTYIWDAQDLDAPVLIGSYTSASPAIDHNQYIVGGYAYQANYRSGLRILDIEDVANANLELVAFFDIYPKNDSASFNGAWSVYPFFESGNVVVSGIEQGLFVLHPRLEPDFDLGAPTVTLAVCGDDSAATPIEVMARNGLSGDVTLSAQSLPATVSATFAPNPVPAPGTSELTLITSGTPAGSYDFQVQGTALTLTHDLDLTLDVYDGLPDSVSLVAPASGATHVALAPTFSWSTGTHAASYLVEVATDPGFNTLVYSATTSMTTHAATATLDPNATFYWRVTASNDCGSGASSAIFSFTSANREILCTQADLAVPDGSLDGASSTFDVGNGGSLTDLDVHLEVTHPWVGDLKVTLSHNGTSVMLIDRPGVPGSTFGCWGDDIHNTVDGAGSTSAETQCQSGNMSAYPAGARLTPNKPLSAFDGMELQGEWTLTVVDAVPADAGFLNAWCLVPALDTPTAIHVSELGSDRLGSRSPALAVLALGGLVALAGLVGRRRA